MYALLCFCDKGIGELHPFAILVKDVALEMNMIACRSDRREPCGIVLGRVNQQPYAIPTNERCTGGARKSLVGKRAGGVERAAFAGCRPLGTRRRPNLSFVHGAPTCANASVE